jgi:nucleoside-diphosphate-sugar epimerase
MRCSCLPNNVVRSGKTEESPAVRWYGPPGRAASGKEGDTGIRGRALAPCGGCGDNPSETAPHILHLGLTCGIPGLNLHADAEVHVDKNNDIDEILSRPAPEVVQALRDLEGDIIVLGAAGKMGPTLAWMALRASLEAGVRRRVLAVARFTRPEVRARLDGWGIETIPCDLLDRGQVAKLPDVPSVVFMAGMKFGTSGQEELTWAENTLVPAHACEKYSRSRIVAFSTGNIYGLAPISGGGSVESDPPAPVGDYASSCVGRERIFAYFSQTLGIRVALLRLNYACELRYGVLVDLARKVLAGETIDLSMGHFNVIWQADANGMALQALAHASSPPLVLNVTGPEVLCVRQVCERFGELFAKPVSFRGKEAPDALLSNASRAHALLSRPRVSAAEMIPRIAGWVRAGGESLGKPTHFEVRDGKF